MTLADSKEEPLFHTRTCPSTNAILYTLPSRDEMDNKFFFKPVIIKYY